MAAQINGLDSRVKDMSEALDKVISEARSTREAMYEVMKTFLVAVGSGEGRHDFSNQSELFPLGGSLSFCLLSTMLNSVGTIESDE